jgi:hypothetical protein
MSYARFSEDSSVYVYEDVSLGLVCCGCIRLGDTVPFAGPDELEAHLVLVHHAAGDRVPLERIMRRVRADFAADQGGAR